MKLDLKQLVHEHHAINTCLGQCYMDSALVGSMYIHGEGNDMDIVVLVRDNLEAMHMLKLSGYQYTGQDSGEEDDFNTYRKGDVNVMTFSDPDLFRRFSDAAEICKQLAVWCVPLSKGMRIKIHRILMNKETAE